LPGTQFQHNQAKTYKSEKVTTFTNCTTYVAASVWLVVRIALVSFLEGCHKRQVDQG